jgi:DNA-binding IclR family transcriptional regulator
MSDLNPAERRIVTVLYHAQKPLSTSDIAKRSEMSWATTKKYLTTLYEKKLLRRAKKGKSIYWWILTN